MENYSLENMKYESYASDLNFRKYYSKTICFTLIFMNEQSLQSLINVLFCIKCAFVNAARIKNNPFGNYA